MSQRQTHRLAALDGLRIVGALMVVTTHVAFSSGDALTGPFSGVLARLDAGVPLFFVVSGFLLYRPHVRARLGVATPAQVVRVSDWRAYARHRALRILPAAWLAVLACALLLRTDGIGLGHYLRIATMTQVYSPQPSVPGLTQMWSLATEVAFYAVLPLLAWGLARLGARGGGGRGDAGLDATWPPQAAAVLACGPLVAVAWTALTHERLSGAMNLWLPAYLGWFAAGMALAVWREARLAGVLRRTVLDDLVAAPGTLWGLAGAVFLLLTTRAAGPLGLTPATALEATTKTLGYTVLAMLVVLPCVAAEEGESRVVAALSGRVGRFLGDLSYGVFCYHLLVLGLVERATGHTPFSGGGLLLWIATVVLTLPLAWASHRYVETPIVRWGRRGDGARLQRRLDQPRSLSTIVDG